MQHFEEIFSKHSSVPGGAGMSLKDLQRMASANSQAGDFFGWQVEKGVVHTPSSCEAIADPP
jgi:hypothetical protein